MSFSIQYQLTESVRTTPERAFAVIDDLPRTAQWLPPCVSLGKVGSGPNEVGDKLKYVYKQGGTTGQMEGQVMNHTPNQRLHCKYFDSKFDVSVDMLVAAAPQGTQITHIIDITPKTFVAKLMSPLIRLGLGKQTRDAARNLKKLLESTSE